MAVDEYTSICCRRYMSICIHYQNYYISLGLTRMYNSCDTEKILELLEKRLADFKINNMQTSIVSTISDGASIMKRFGKIFILCYACWLHLAVHFVKE